MFKRPKLKEKMDAAKVLLAEMEEKGSPPEGNDD